MYQSIPLAYKIIDGTMFCYLLVTKLLHQLLTTSLKNNSFSQIQCSNKLTSNSNAFLLWAINYNQNEDVIKSKE